MATTTATKKPPAKKASTAGGAAKKSSSAKTAAATATKKSTAKKPAAKKPAAAKAAASKTATTKATATKTTAAKAAPKKATVGERLTGQKAVKAKALVVGKAEEPWSKAELAEVRTELEAELARLTSELEIAEHDLYELVSSSIGTQGDEADAGSFSNERQHEMQLADNSRALVLQTTTALGRIAAGTYGQCESCGEAIGKMRLQAFPRATLCMPCKQHQERR